MSKKGAGSPAWATILAAIVGTVQVSMAQMNGGGGMRETNQYGALGILGLVIGVAVLILLVVLVARKSRT